MNEDTQRALQRAKSLIEAKRYEDARAVLLTIDHPTADKWLARLNAMAASRPAPTQYVQEQSFTVKLVLTIILLFVFVLPGIIALSIFGREAKAAQKAAGHPLPGTKELIMLNRFIFLLFVAFVVLLIVGFVLIGPNTIAGWLYP